MSGWRRLRVWDMARKLGKTTVDLGDIESIKSESYRDTKGISVEQFKSMLEEIDPSTPIGVRDYAIMLLFWGNALRRGEIASANIEDFLPQQRKLMILGKGKRAKVSIDLTDSVSYALEEWLNFHPCNAPGQPLSCLDAHNLEGTSRRKCAGGSFPRTPSLSMRRCRTQPGAANCGEVSSPSKFDKTGNQRVDAPLITRKEREV